MRMCFGDRRRLLQIREFIFSSYTLGSHTQTIPSKVYSSECTSDAQFFAFMYTISSSWVALDWRSAVKCLGAKVLQIKSYGNVLISF